MIGEFLTRLAIALPLVTALAILFLVAVKKGWIRLPAAGNWRGPTLRRPFWRLPLTTGRHETEASMRVLSVQAIAPTARVAVVSFHGREHLLAVNGQTLLLVASEDMARRPTPGARP